MVSAEILVSYFLFNSMLSLYPIYYDANRACCTMVFNYLENETIIYYATSHIIKVKSVPS